MNITCVEPLGISEEQFRKTQSAFAAEGHSFNYFMDRREDEATLAERMKDSEIVIISNIKLSSAVLAQCQKLKMLSVAFTGLDHIDLNYCKEHNIKFQEHTAFNEKVIADADILYMTRVQKERFSDLMEYERVKNVYILNNDMLRLAKPNMRILHPLPRVNEIAYDVDDNPHAYYIQQAGNGLFAREAIFCDVLGISLEEVKKDKTIIK